MKSKWSATLTALILLLLTHAAQSKAAGILWIGAHPDDELPVSAYWNKYCASGLTPCRWVVLTKGEAGGCHIPGGCFPNLATLRTQELINSANFNGASVVQYDLGDGTAPDDWSQVIANWSRRLGGPENLNNIIHKEIAAFEPDFIVTFDPRHGTTCHPDHRAAGTLAIQVARSAGFPSSNLYMLESFASASKDPTGKQLWLGLIPAFSATAPLWGMDVSSLWSVFLQNASIYRSQFNASALALFAAAPTEPVNGQTLSLMSVAQAMEGSSAGFDQLCP